MQHLIFEGSLVGPEVGGGKFCTRACTEQEHPNESKRKMPSTLACPVKGYHLNFFGTVTVTAKAIAEWASMTTDQTGSGSATTKAHRDSSEYPANLTDSRQGGASAESSASSTRGTDLSKLVEEVASLRDTLTKYISDAGSDAAKTVRDVGQSVTSQIGGAASGVMDAGASMANTASKQTKTFISEIESAARQNPLGAMAGALLVGVLIGLLGRGRG
jgi:ElaB/YqjD/DUF883 family membrane-anchored ribosome-binding protein